MNTATVTSLESSTTTSSLRNAHNGSSNPKEAAEPTTSEKQRTTDELRRAVQRKYRHVAAVHHRSRPSTLSHDSNAAPSFIGFRNLMYGVLICVRCHDFRRQDLALGLGLYLLIPCHLFAAYLIELAAAQQARGLRSKSKDGAASPTHDQRARFNSTWMIIAWIHTVNITLALAVTSYVVYFHIHHPLIGTLTELHAIIVWLKTASYAFTNRDLRHAYLHPVKGELAAMPEIYQQCPYPQNITMHNLAYFWWAPTLVYQPAYPRTDKIRWLFVAKRMAEVFGLGVFIWFASAQYAAPVLINSLDKIASLDVPKILERLMKLSTISLVIWLAGFFALFQSFLNALAEVTCFGDRCFYEDWWNSESLGAYWRLWNKPVYQYFKRHVYSPLIGRGWSPRAAQLAVFFASAVLHEVLVGIPTHNIIGVAFAGMFLQLPLIAITTPLEKMQTPTGRMLGNCIFWVSFTILGQPFAALMYFYAWQAKYGSVSRQIAWSSASSS
ncbi:diacylglycerol O-acyltransferase 1 [Colletotrichum spaethianum]|uniref:O-acyltransferase n=1 Tax=Colletotrichum spaethianum TaxID=700344 RepID=A0AA37P0S1_9PEZI|nr:diacylglycerol O-acyltransferase 1 [Colletotrichum spaethianum]GKT43928.1 diacylglycerol O-acyltransferase 1 [Colletotrichum spaethianum]